MSTADRASWNKDEEVIHVDENDREVAALSRDMAHDKGILHRAFAVFLIDDAGHILLCRRSKKKRLWPGYWTDSCSGHPFPKEDIVAAGKRRVKEELGCDVNLIDVGRFIYKMSFEGVGVEHELCHVLVGRATQLSVNPDEVSETWPVSAKWLAEQADDPPKDFAPWLVQAIRAFSPLRIKTQTLI